MDMKKVCYAAIQLARIWGIMETLGRFPPMDKAPVENGFRGEECLLKWAEEYVHTEQEDIVEFLKKKMKST